MTISTDKEKAFDTIQHPFLVKQNKTTTQQSGYRGNVLQHNKGYI